MGEKKIIKIGSLIVEIPVWPFSPYTDDEIAKLRSKPLERIKETGENEN